MNKQITLEEIPPLDDYAAQRDAFRSRIMVVKKNRHVSIGDNVTLLFENRDTVFYQVMEMLRIEKTEHREGIQQELDAYNPLIPDGSNWKATMLIEFPEEVERRVQLKSLRNVEHQVWCDVGGRRVIAIADEDLERSDEEKTSSVHFLRFELDAKLRQAALDGADIRFGIDHDRYHCNSGILHRQQREALVEDLSTLH